MFPPIEKPKPKPVPPSKVEEKNEIIHSAHMFEGTMNTINSVPASIVSVSKYRNLVLRKHAHAQRDKEISCAT